LSSASADAAGGDENSTAATRYVVAPPPRPRLDDSTPKVTLATSPALHDAKSALTAFAFASIGRPRARTVRAGSSALTSSAAPIARGPERSSRLIDERSAPTNE
jgi:hypothetical protein